MKNLYLLFALFTCSFTFSQVGIGTTTPSASSQLDVSAANKGVLIPRVELTGPMDATTVTPSNVESLLVYNTGTVNGVSPGFYYWSAGSWNRLMTEKQASLPKFFYMPSIAMPTSSAHFVTGDGFTISGGVFSVNLYNRYVAQFGTPEINNPSRNTTLPVLLANQLDYSITYYDKAVFEAVTLSDAGVLAYKIKTGAQVTAATFMNIVFAVKP